MTTADCRGKVLLLHGSRQTGDLLLGRMDKLRKRLEKQNLEIVAPTGSFVHPEDPNLRQWWNRTGGTYEGLLEETLPELAKLWDEVGREADQRNSCPFVGILGFSQGARLAHLCCLAHTAQPKDVFAGLKFVIMVAGYEAPLPTGFEELHVQPGPHDAEHSVASKRTYDGFVQIPSLHVYGMADNLIAPDSSRAVLAYYNNPQIHEHERGHHVPMRAASVRAYEEFIQSSLQRLSTSTTRMATTNANYTVEDHPSSVSPPAPTPVPDDETIQLQRDEVEALTAIFPDEFHMLSAVSEEDDDDMNVYDHPIRYLVDLIPSDEGTWPLHPVAIEVQYPHNYPQSALPDMRLVHENNMMEFATGQSEALLNVMREAAQTEEGMPSVMSCVYAARDFFESGAMASISAASQDSDPIIKTAEQPETAIKEERVQMGVESRADESEYQHTGLLLSSSRERIEEFNLQGLEIARTVLDQMRPLAAESCSSNGDFALGKGGHMTFTIGLVGKPSAGKSTFFNAATAFARQRDDSENLLGGATMAPHPFTTIDPNVGYCLVPAPSGSCPEDHYCVEQQVSSKPSFSVGSMHGRDNKGRRMIPVLLKDVAGLVPGAYQGRGRGNKFLNDLTDADVLVHVLDTSGTGKFVRIMIAKCFTTGMSPFYVPV